MNYEQMKNLIGLIQNGDKIPVGMRAELINTFNNIRQTSYNVTKIGPGHDDYVLNLDDPFTKFESAVDFMKQFLPGSLVTLEEIKEGGWLALIRHGLFTAGRSGPTPAAAVMAALIDHYFNLERKDNREI